MSYKSLSNYIRALLGYLIIGLLFPWLWLQGIYLKKVVLRLPTPDDAPFGVLKGSGRKLKILGLGESPMAGVGIAKTFGNVNRFNCGPFKSINGLSSELEGYGPKWVDDK